MEQRGFALNVIPSYTEDGLYTFDIFQETWQHGALSSIEMLSRTAVEFDPEWIGQIPVDQFVFTMLEVASQLLIKVSGPENVASFREAIARAVDKIENVSLDD